jgi:hypothetical protein
MNHASKPAVQKARAWTASSCSIPGCAGGRAMSRASIAALHRLLGRRHGKAVERIHSEGDRYHRQQHWLGKTHL